MSSDVTSIDERAAAAHGEGADRHDRKRAVVREHGRTAAAVLEGGAGDVDAAACGVGDVGTQVAAAASAYDRFQKPAVGQGDPGTSAEHAARRAAGGSVYDHDGAGVGQVLLEDSAGRGGDRDTP